jgi:hypothetical protein
MQVASICFKCFKMFHTYVCECFIWMLHMFAMVFKCFSSIFASVSDVCFKCFICLLLYVAIVASECFKNRPGVTHGIHVGSGRWRRWCSGCVGPLLVCSLASTTRYTVVCSLCASALASGRTCTGASKSDIWNIKLVLLDTSWNIFQEYTYLIS